MTQSGQSQEADPAGDASGQSSDPATGPSSDPALGPSSGQSPSSGSAAEQSFGQSPGQSPAVVLRFVSGTVEVAGLGGDAAALLPGCQWDPRAGCHRGAAVDYAAIVRALVRAGIAYEDRARAYTELDAGLRAHRQPRPYQLEALEAWMQQRSRGVVVLPTGAGKSQVALMAIDARRRSTLVVAPTLDLVRQWYDLVRTSFGVPVGVIGGGDYRLAPLTITTYDSAYLHMEHLGARFGLVVFDECHHLPSEAYALAARFCLAPFRLGLTATPERADGREAVLDELIGPLVYRRDIVELSGDYLAPYETVTIEVDLVARGAEAPRRCARRVPRLRDPRGHPHEQSDRVVGVRDARGAERGRAAGHGRVPPPASPRSDRVGQARLRGAPAARAPPRPDDRVHAGQRHGL